MPQLERFICITYPQIDFLIPSDYVASSVGIKDLSLSLLSDQKSGFFDFDEIASQFIQIPRESTVKTMIVLKDVDGERLSLLTTQECKVCMIDLREFGLFSDFYSEQFKKLGFLACSFNEERLRMLMDVRQTVKYLNDCFLEEL